MCSSQPPGMLAKHTKALCCHEPGTPCPRERAQMGSGRDGHGTRNYIPPQEGRCSLGRGRAFPERTRDNGRLDANRAAVPLELEEALHVVEELRDHQVRARIHLGQHARTVRESMSSSLRKRLHSNEDRPLTIYQEHA